MIRVLKDLNSLESRFEGVPEQIFRLHKASVSGSPADIREIVRLGADVDSRDGMRMTPLMSAAYNERLENILTLLELGAEINARDYVGSNVLHLSCSNKGTDCTKALMDAGADMEAMDISRHRPLHMASIHDSKELLEYYISRSESLEELGAVGRTPLMLSASYGKLTHFETLIGHGANTSVVDEFGCNLLFISAENPDPEILRRVMQLGCHINSRNNLGMTALFNAAGTDNIENTKILLNAGIDINAKSRNGETALHNAAYVAGEEMIKLLAVSKSIVNLQDASGKTALHTAAVENNPEAVKALLESGADINCMDGAGHTPILAAAKLNRIEPVKLLFEAGADTSIVSKDGSGLIELAKRALEGSLGDDSLKFLKENGVQEQPKPFASQGYSEPISEVAEPGSNSEGKAETVTFVTDTKVFSEWAGTFAGKSTPVKFGEVLEKLGVPSSLTINLRNWGEFTTVLSTFGFGLAPYLVLTNRVHSINDPVYIYKTTENHYLPGKPERFRNAVADLGVGSYILSLGNFSSKEMGQALREVAAYRTDLNEGERAGIQANIEHLRKFPTDAGLIDSLLEANPDTAKDMMRNIAVTVAKGLNVGKAKKLSAMEAFYEYLKLDPKLAHSDLQSGGP